MKAEIKTITPEWAARILAEKNTNNRNLSQIHVQTIAKEIRQGRWKVNGDTICLNGDQLIDGQHRLAAVVLSGMAIQSWVIEGLPSDVFDTKDIGKRRSASDTLSVAGYKNTTRLAAVLIFVDKYLRGKSDVSVIYSNTEVERLLNKYPDIDNYILFHFKGKTILPLSIIDSCYYLFSKKDQVLADDFIEKVLHGIGLDKRSSWYVLRERLLKNTQAKAKLSRPYLFALCIKAWNSARKGQEIKNLRYREEGECVERFPVIQ